MGVPLQLRFQQVHVALLFSLRRLCAKPYITVVMEHRFFQAVYMEISAFVPHLMNGSVIACPSGHAHHANCHKITVGTYQISTAIVSDYNAAKIIPVHIGILQILNELRAILVQVFIRVH